jgi:hypothetical protein
MRDEIQSRDECGDPRAIWSVAQKKWHSRQIDAKAGSEEEDLEHSGQTPAVSGACGGIPKCNGRRFESIPHLGIPSGANPLKVPLFLGQRPNSPCVSAFLVQPSIQFCDTVRGQ